MPEPIPEPDSRAGLCDLARRWIRCGWQDPDLDAFTDLHDPAFVDHSAAGREPNLAGFWNGVAALYSSFPDFTATVEDLAADPEAGFVAVRWSAVGTQRGRFLGFPATGCEIRFAGIEILRCARGRIRERWGEWNEGEIVQQLRAHNPGAPGPGVADQEARRIRPIAICVFQNGDRILVARAFDSVKQQEFCRPLGGAIEFGERAEEAIGREVVEELGTEATELELLGVIENTFMHEGRPGHEIVFVFTGRLGDAALYLEPELPLNEAGWESRARWVALDELEGTGVALYPEGLLELLRRDRTP